jgi:stage II sporulation protein AA (anti-sigma F factor antagonist)
VLVIDFTRVEFMDSSGLGLILGRVEKASALGAEVMVSGASPALMKLIRLSGIERVRHLSVVK